MRLNVNLSPRPFRNHRILWIIILILGLITIGIGMRLVSLRTEVLARAETADKGIRNLQDDVMRRKNEEEARRIKEEGMKLSDDEGIQLASARRMILRRSFSWNGMLSDLAEYVPENTRLTDVQVEDVYESTEGLAASLQVGAIGKSTNQLTEMMEMMEKSGGVFTVGDAVQDQVDDKGLIPFKMRVYYVHSRSYKSE